MKASVIIPLYNKGTTITRALHSIAAQTWRDFEVIVVDDGSTDNGADQAGEFKSLPLRVIRQKNAGPGRARNRGVEAAGGDILAFLDADDEWLPDYLRHSIMLLQQDPRAAAAVSGYLEYPGGRPRALLWQQRGVREGAFEASPETPVMELVHRLAYMCPWSTVIRAPVFRRLGGFYEQDRCLYAEDAHLWLKVLLNERVVFSLTPMVRFHRENSALSGARQGTRPIEPFLTRPAAIIEAAPPHLRRLAVRVLALRAAKTSCMLGYWGQWRDASRLMRRHFRPELLMLPYGVPALICSTPLGASLGLAVRACREAGAAVKNLAGTTIRKREKGEYVRINASSGRGY